MIGCFAAAAGGGSAPFEFGNALQFDGVNDFVLFSYNASYNFGSSDFALSAWVKKDKNNVQQMIIARDGNTDRCFAFSFTTSNTIRIFYKKAVSNCFQDTTNTITDTNWHWIVAQKRSNQFEIYIDGVAATLGTLSGTHGAINNSTVEPISVGNRQLTGFENYLSGTLDEVTVFNASFSSGAITDAWNSGNFIDLSINQGNYNLANNRVLHTRLNGSGTDTVAIDISTTANNGTLNNFTLPGAWVAH